MTDSPDDIILVDRSAEDVSFCQGDYAGYRRAVDRIITLLDCRGFGDAADLVARTLGDGSEVAASGGK